MTLSATSRGSGSTNTGGQSTLVISPTSNMATGNKAVLCVAYDNSAAAGADPILSMSDSKGNTWSFDIVATNGHGAPNDGIVGRIMSTMMNNGGLTTGDTITIVFSVTTVALAWTLYELLAADGQFPQEVNEAAAAQTSATPSITTASIATGTLIVCAVARAANGTRTADGDATNGTFSNPQNAGVGAGAVGAEIISETKVATGTATQTYNPTFGGASADGVNLWSQHQETVRPRVPRFTPMPQLVAQ